MPKGFGIWVVFLGLMTLSLTQVHTPARAALWTFRAALFVSSALALLYAYNLARSQLSDIKLLRALGVYWLFIITAGWAALIFGSVEFTSLAQNLLPASLGQEPFVAAMFSPTLAQIHGFLGFEVARPAAPFSYTNGWGSNVALWTPFFALWAATGGRRRRMFGAVALAFALVPIVQSLNRGLWLSLTAGMAYTAYRYAIKGKARPLLGLGVVIVAVGFSLVFSSLGDLAQDRLETGHSDDHRARIYSLSIEAVIESPVVGHGGTVSNPEAPDRSPAGTHGQIWELLVVFGIPATVTFLGLLAYLIGRTRLAPPGTFGFWTHTVLVIACVQLPFYSLLPSQLPVLMVVTGIALREIDQSPVRSQKSELT